MHVCKIAKRSASVFSGSVPSKGGHFYERTPNYENVFNTQGSFLLPDGKGIESDAGATGLADVEILLKNDKNVLTVLEGNGDFRSRECVELLKQADIVVTNPPFSLFREYVAQLVEYGKEFIIVANKNAITYKEIFKLIKENRLWLGYRNINQDMWLILPDEEEKYEKIIDGKKMKHIMACWFTNIETTKRHEELILYKKYTPAVSARICL